MRGIFCQLELGKPLARQLAVVVIAKSLVELLIAGLRHRKVVVFFGQASAPVKRGRDFRG